MVLQDSMWIHRVRVCAATCPRRMSAGYGMTLLSAEELWICIELVLRIVKPHHSPPLLAEGVQTRQS
jgi:hypothetical protein